MVDFDRPRPSSLEVDDGTAVAYYYSVVDSQLADPSKALFLNSKKLVQLQRPRPLFRPQKKAEKTHTKVCFKYEDERGLSKK